VEQQINSEFCVKICRNGTETLTLLTLAYGEYTVKKLNIFLLQRRFKAGREDAHSSGPSLCGSLIAGKLFTINSLQKDQW
jgi:hypothetical protein